MQFVIKLRQLIDTMVHSWSMREWMAFSAVMVIAGFVCMRGYGSRTNY